MKLCKYIILLLSAFQTEGIFMKTLILNNSNIINEIKRLADFLMTFRRETK